SATVMKLLLGAIDGGIPKGAQVPGYSIAGKTGTAEIAGPVKVSDASGKVGTRNRYIAGWIDSAFIGGYPASRPQLGTLSRLHRRRAGGRAAGWPRLRPSRPACRSGGRPGGATGAAPSGEQRIPGPGGRSAHRPPGPGRMVAIAVSDARGGDHRLDRQDVGQG